MNDLNSNPAELPDATETHFSVTENSVDEFSEDKMDFVRTESGEATVRRVLASYELGQKLRQLRLRKKIALVDLGKHTGLSASMLSQLENGKLVPTLPTLARIAMVFDVGLDHFFGSKRGKRLFSHTPAAERMKFPERPDIPKPSYFFECLAYSVQDKPLQVYWAEFPKRADNEVTEHFHEGAEFIFVMEGAIAIRYGGEDHIVRAGDSLYFDAAEAHSYRGLSKTPARAFVVTTAPRT